MSETYPDTDLTPIVARIAASAQEQEQAVGLNQVNTAVNQMDQMTQKNAAMVEQSTAASHGMAREAKALNASLASFQLHDGTRRGEPAAPSSSARPQRSAGSRTGGAAAALKPLPVAEEGWEEF